MVTDWPPVTVIVGGDGSTPAARHTVTSLGHSQYPGELQILTGDPEEPGSPAEVTNNHVGEARGDYIMMVRPGTTLDPHCMRYLVERARAGTDPVAIAPQWRAGDGTVVEAGSHLRASDEISPLFRGADLPPWLSRVSYSTEISSQPSLLVRARDFFMAGGFNLDLDGSPYQAAHLALSLTAGGDSIEVETRAVAFAPPPDDATPADLVRGRNVLQDDFSERLDQLHYQSSIDADLSVLLGDQLGTRTLWAALHLPDATRSGADARHLQMIEALMARDDEVVVWAEHTDGSDRGGLDELGIRWVAQPHAHRWSLGQGDTKFPWLKELIRQLHWDHIVLADPNLVARVEPLIRELSPNTRIIADLGSVRFPEAHDATLEVEFGSSLPGFEGVDGLVAATRPDQIALEKEYPDIPTSVFTAINPPTSSSAHPEGGLLFVGNLLHRPNSEAVAWWIEAIAGRVEARTGVPVPLRVVGNGSDLYRQTWNHPTKVEIGGWQSDLTTAFSRARVFLVPLPYATGTGSRIASAIAHGVPTVVSAPAASMLDPLLQELVYTGETADELAAHVANLMSDDVEWEAAVERLRSWEGGPAVRTQSTAFAEWADALQATGRPVPA